MKARVAQAMNEIVSLTLMLLMTIALIAAQADATAEERSGRHAPSGQDGPQAGIDAVLEARRFELEMVLVDGVVRIPDEDWSDTVSGHLRFRLRGEE